MDGLTVDVITTVDTHAGQQTPALSLKLDKESMQVSGAAAQASAASSSGATGTDPMVATATTTHDDPVVVENSLKIMGWSIGIDLMRKLGMALLLVGVWASCSTGACPRATPEIRTPRPTATTAWSCRSPRSPSTTVR